MKAAIGYALALIATLTFAFAFVRLHPRASTSAAQPAPAAPTAAVASARPPERSRSWVGIVLANRSVDVSPRTASLVRTTNVRAGDVVKKGTPLATLEARDKASALRAAAAAHRNQAARTARSRVLRAEAAISIEEAENAEFEAARQSAELDLARVFVDDAIVRAPFDGIIVARFVEPGTHVAAGTPMFRMIDKGGARLRFGVPIAVADTLTPGQSVGFVNPALGGPTGAARITSISPELDRSVGLVVIEAEAGAIGTFRSGTEVSVYLDGVPAGTDVRSP